MASTELVYPHKMLQVNYFSMLPKLKTTSQCAGMCHASRLWSRNNKPYWFPSLKGMRLWVTVPLHGLPDNSRCRDTEI